MSIKAAMRSLNLLIVACTDMAIDFFQDLVSTLVGVSLKNCVTNVKAQETKPRLSIGKSIYELLHQFGNSSAGSLHGNTPARDVKRFLTSSSTGGQCGRQDRAAIDLFFQHVHTLQVPCFHTKCNPYCIAVASLSTSLHDLGTGPLSTSLERETIVKLHQCTSPAVCLLYRTQEKKNLHIQ